MRGEWLTLALDELERAGLKRRLREVASRQGPELELDGKHVLNFCSNDYLSLAGDKRLIEAGKSALEKWGCGAGASRLIAGNLGLFNELEQRLAEFCGYQAALLFNSGYHANLGVIPALVGRGDVVLSDSLNHASIIDGCRLSRAQVKIYEHLDLESLERGLKDTASANTRLVVSESVFSMEGDLCPLPELIELTNRYDAMLMLDEAHAIGVLGDMGSGAVEHFGIREKPDLIMGTLGKSLGSAGAFIAGSRELIEYLINRARPFVFTTGPSPAAAGAAIKGLEICMQEPQLRQGLHSNMKYLAKGLEAQGMSVAHSPSAILPVMIGDPKRTMELCDSLLSRGIFVQGIRPPTVPEGTSRLRITLNAGHTEAQVQRLVQALGSD